MKLTVFNKETYPMRSNRVQVAAINFGKTGAITLNEIAAERIGIKDGDAISFAQDEDDPANWYVFKHVDGYQVRLHSDKKSFVFSHSAMCQSIKESLGLPADSSARFIISKEPQADGRVKYWGLINVKK